MLVRINDKHISETTVCIPIYFKPSFNCALVPYCLITADIVYHHGLVPLEVKDCL